MHVDMQYDVVARFKYQKNVNAPTSFLAITLKPIGRI